MARLQLGAFLDDDAIETPPIPSRAHPDGHVYRVESPSASIGLKLAAMASLGFRASAGQPLTDADREQLQLDDDEERDLYRMVLGDTYQQMLVDGVSWVRLQRLGTYLFLYFGMSPEVAQQTLEAGALSGEAEAPNRATRRAAKKATPSKSTGRGSRGSSRTTARAAKA
jgi:hypothetical protein